MGSELRRLWTCDECSAPFRMTVGESMHAAGVKCPACGSRFVTRQITRGFVKTQVGINSESNIPHGEAVSPANRPNGKKGSPRATRKTARMHGLMSFPSKYRAVALANAHKRRSFKLAKAAREQRIKDFTVFK